MVKVNLGFGKASYGTVAEKDSNTGKYQPVENSSLAKNDSTVIGAISSEGFLVFCQPKLMMTVWSLLYVG